MSDTSYSEAQYDYDRYVAIGRYENNLKDARENKDESQKILSKARGKSNLNGGLLLSAIFASAFAFAKLPQEKPLVGVFSLAVLAPLVLRVNKLNREEKAAELDVAVDNNLYTEYLAEYKERAAICNQGDNPFTAEII